MKHYPRASFRKTGVALLSIAAVATIWSSVATPAHAASDTDTSTAAVRDVSPTAVSAAAPSAQLAAVDGNVVNVSGARGRIGVTLPLSTTPVEKLADGLVELSDVPSSSIVPVAQTDGSVAIHSVLNNAAAPRTYDYVLDLPDDAILMIDKGGAVVALDRDSQPLLFATAPWATDAAGKPVSTRYTVSGHTLTQHVDVVDDTVFPIVADPWLGIDLISWAGPNGGRIDINPTPWARSFTGNPSYGVVGQAGWHELGDRYPSVRHLMNASTFNQYICHMGFAGFDPQWNLESWKPDKGLAGFISSQCN